MKKINVLQLITGLGMGGAEKVVLDLSSFINKEKFGSSVVSLNDRIELLDSFKIKNIKTKVLFGKNNLYDLFRLFFKVNSYVKDNSIQIIHAHMTHSLIIASFVKLLRPSLKIVYTSHNLNIGSKYREYIVWLLRPLRNLDIVFSEDILKFFYKKKHLVIPNGINIERYNLDVDKAKVFTITSIGRLEYVKNHTFLIDLANQLKDSIDFKIQIVGAGELEDQLKKKTSDLSLDKYVKFLGLRDDIPEILNSSHCFALPSYWEGLPIVLLEAAASKLPIISTPVGSIPSLINYNSGILCELEEFAENIIAIKKNYKSAIIRAELLFENVNKNYSISEIVQQHEQVYENLFNEK
jgi:glycosyltransferase involved in cell wall biosynthesis